MPLALLWSLSLWLDRWGTLKKDPLPRPNSLASSSSPHFEADRDNKKLEWNKKELPLPTQVHLFQEREWEGEAHLISNPWSLAIMWWLIGRGVREREREIDQKDLVLLFSLTCESAQRGGKKDGCKNPTQAEKDGGSSQPCSGERNSQEGTQRPNPSPSPSLSLCALDFCQIFRRSAHFGPPSICKLIKVSPFTRSVFRGSFKIWSFSCLQWFFGFFFYVGLWKRWIGAWRDWRSCSSRWPAGEKWWPAWVWALAALEVISRQVSGASKNQSGEIACFDGSVPCGFSSENFECCLGYVLLEVVLILNLVFAFCSLWFEGSRTLR